MFIHLNLTKKNNNDIQTTKSISLVTNDYNQHFNLVINPFNHIRMNHDDKFSHFVKKYEVVIAIIIVLLMLMVLGHIQSTGEEWR